MASLRVLPWQDQGSNEGRELWTTPLPGPPRSTARSPMESVWIERHPNPSQPFVFHFPCTILHDCSRNLHDSYFYLPCMMFSHVCDYSLDPTLQCIAWPYAAFLRCGLTNAWLATSPQKLHSPWTSGGWKHGRPYQGLASCGVGPSQIARWATHMPTVPIIFENNILKAPSCTRESFATSESIQNQVSLFCSAS